MKNILIIGASSAIAQAVCRVYATQNANMLLLGRDEEMLASQKADIEIRGAQRVNTLTFDALDFQKHSALIEQCFVMMPKIDLVFIAYGSLPDQQACENDPRFALNEINRNGNSVVLLLSFIANKMSQQGFGHIAVISSVAGDRGRQSNYIYGSAKALVSTYLQGLRGRLFKENIYVTDIKPGFIDTPMTAAIENKGALWATPEKVAEDIVRGIKKRKPVIYTPWFWRWVMLIIRLVPEVVFKRLSL